ncbi:MAG TPA: S1 RNA-binding domain-containing protein [Thermoanaerobacterium sp.]|nr:S1 RNA-binding domain-containing protein [Thermoanaerobacterium sp.]
MDDFMNEYTFNEIHAGDIVKGKIIKILNDGIIADIGYKSDAFVPKSQLSLNPNIKISDDFNVGDEIDLYIIKREDENGDVLASKVKADTELAEERLNTSFKNGDILNGKIIEVVKGGVVAEVLGVKAFIPASQLDMHYVDDLNSYLGEKIEVKIIDYIPSKKLVASRRIVLEEEKSKKKETLLKNIREGQVINGVVRSIAKFGVFVDLGCIDGLIPLREISWSKNVNINDVLHIGDRVDVYVDKIDQEKITLSLKKLFPDPWVNINEKFKVGDIILGIITNVTTFGAFVEISEGLEGLAHKNDLIKNVKEYKIGDEITVEIISFDSEKKKLSLKEVEKNSESYDLEREELNVTIKDRIQNINNYS